MENSGIQSEDTKVATERKQPNPGKKLVKVKKTRYVNIDGYMEAEDYFSYEEQDDFTEYK